MLSSDRPCFTCTTQSTPGIQELLDVAKQDIPFDFWKATPLVLKATAGLRLLPGEKAQKLLEKVKEVFKASPFLVGDDCVSIMNGTDEGVSAWITINFLTGHPSYLPPWPSDLAPDV